MKNVNLILTIVGSWLYCISISAQWCCIDSSLAIIDDGSTEFEELSSLIETKYVEAYRIDDNVVYWKLEK